MTIKIFAAARDASDEEPIRRGRLAILRVK